MTHTAAVLFAIALATGCWRIGEPTSSDAVVAWAAYPDTVVAGQIFPFEFAGPITPNSCGRLDTAVVAVSDAAIEIQARRVTYDVACARTPIGFYEVRSLTLPAGTYDVRSGAESFGHIVALDSGSFSEMRTAGRGTVDEGGGCLLFGPGRLGNQRPFALQGAPGEVREVAGSDRLVRVRGTLSGFTLCGGFGSRPAIRVDEARVLDETLDDYYED
ncbi:MAG: hypothetical protein ACR2GQ_02045 [Gemmatimonadota bacterium]